MPATPGTPAAGSDVERAERAWRRMRGAVAARRGAILDEIASYPAPIPACDAQFNHLLELRDAASRASLRLGGGPPSVAPLHSCRALLEELVSAGLIGGPEARALRRLLGPEGGAR